MPFSMQSPSMFAGGAGSLISGLFQDQGAPYGAAMDQYQKYFDQARGFQNPFYQAGTGAIPQYQDLMKRMSDPTGFMNNIMGQYQQSPYAQYQQQQAMRAAQNMGSAGGMGGTGSTPLMQFAQQNAQGITSQDQNRWLQNVLGINNQYQGGLQNMMGMGQNSANSLSNLYSQQGQNMAQAAYGQEAGNQQNNGNLFGGAAMLGMSMIPGMGMMG